MNFIQKNPNDPRYKEFHDGEYEYWPVDTPIKTKSISIPAAVVSGLELLAAAAAAGLLAVALAVLYVVSSPLAIHEHDATINVNIYNNPKAHTIAYTLATTSDPDHILREGTLEESQDRLYLDHLRSGTEYILVYYNADDTPWEQVGQFRFRTPGDPEFPADGVGPLSPGELTPDSTDGPRSPAETETAESTLESTAETTEEATEETTEETTEPDIPVWYPPRPTPRPDPAPVPTPTPKPTQPEPEETQPETETFQPETEATEPGTEATEPGTEPSLPATEATEPENIPAVTVSAASAGRPEYVAPEDSGDEIDAYFRIEQTHVFQNVPAGDYEIQVLQGDTPITEFSQERSADGTVTVSFTGGLFSVGRATETTVTLTTGGYSFPSTLTVFPPSLESTGLTVEENADGSHTFTVTADVLSDGREEMVCEALLYPTTYGDGISLPMTAESSGRYTAAYTGQITETEEQDAMALITAYWASVSPGSYNQSEYCYFTYTP